MMMQLYIKYVVKYSLCRNKGALTFMQCSFILCTSDIILSVWNFRCSCYIKKTECVCVLYKTHSFSEQTCLYQLVDNFLYAYTKARPPVLLLAFNNGKCVIFYHKSRILETISDISSSLCFTWSY